MKVMTVRTENGRMTNLIMRRSHVKKVVVTLLCLMLMALPIFGQVNDFEIGALTEGPSLMLGWAVSLQYQTPVVEYHNPSAMIPIETITYTAVTPAAQHYNFDLANGVHMIPFDISPMLDSKKYHPYNGNPGTGTLLKYPLLRHSGAMIL